MGKLKKLQAKYLKGEITKKEYDAEVKKLLDEDILDQEAYDDALEYDPEEEKPQFTQADVDRMVVSKAVKMVRKTLKDAGIDGLDGVGSKELLPKVAEMLKGKKKKDDEDDEGGQAKENKEAEKWKKAYEKAVEGSRDLTIENAVLKAAGKYNPVNMSQVVRALKLDYMDLVDIDDDGKVDAKTVDRALKRIVSAEPNLFKGDGSDEEDDEGNDNNAAGGFKGKAPGGGAGSGSSKSTDLDKKAAEAMKLMGIEPATK